MRHLIEYLFGNQYDHFVKTLIRRTVAGKISWYDSHNGMNSRFKASINGVRVAVIGGRIQAEQTDEHFTEWPTTKPRSIKRLEWEIRKFLLTEHLNDVTS